MISNKVIPITNRNGQKQIHLKMSHNLFEHNNMKQTIVFCKKLCILIDFSDKI